MTEDSYLMEIACVLKEFEDMPDFLQYNTEKETAELIEKLIVLVGAKHVLELGTYQGYTTTHMMRAVYPDGVVVTVDHNDQRLQSVKKLTHHFVLGSLPEAIDKVGTGFDLVFIDATHEPGQVKAEFNRLYQVTAPQAFYLFHDANCLNGLQPLIERWIRDGYLQGLILPTPERVSGDGRTLIRANLAVCRRM